MTNTINFPSYADAKAKLFNWDYICTSRHGNTERWVNQDLVAIVNTQDATARLCAGTPVRVQFINN